MGGKNAWSVLGTPFPNRREGNRLQRPIVAPWGRPCDVRCASTLREHLAGAGPRDEKRRSGDALPAAFRLVFAARPPIPRVVVFSQF